MGILFVVLSIMILLVVTIAFGALRTSRTGRRRDVMGRSRPRLGLAMLVLGLVGLVGGQLYALAAAPGDLASIGEEEIRVLVPKEGPGTDDRFVVRVLTYSDLVPGEPVLLEHLSLVMTTGETVSTPTAGSGLLEPGEYEFEISRTADGRHRLHVDARVVRDLGTLQSSSSQVLEEEGTSVYYLDLGPRATQGRFTALFPASTFPAAIVPTTLVVTEAAPAGVAEAGVATVLSRAAEHWSRLIDSGQRNPAGSVTHYDHSRGIATLFGRLGIYAWLMLALTGIGSALLTRRPGLGLGIFLLMAPLLLAGLDRYSLNCHRDVLGHEDVRVRASAMVGLQKSVLFGRSGTGEVATVASKGGETDREIAERVREMLPGRNWGKVRNLIGTGGKHRSR